MYAKLKKIVTILKCVETKNELYIEKLCATIIFGLSSKESIE